MPTRTGGTVKEVNKSKGSPTIYGAVIGYPAADPPPPPAEDVTYPDIEVGDYEDFRDALGKSGVTVDVTTNSGGSITGIKTKKTQ